MDTLYGFDMNIEYVNIILNLSTLFACMVILYHTRKADNNTNLMKDALAEATSKLSRAEGKEEGRTEAEEKATHNGPIPVEVVGTQQPIPVKVVAKDVKK